MSIKLIVAKAENNAIGKGNDLIWHLPSDLKFFKENTINGALIMGRKTFDSIGRPLPKRQTIIITRDTSYTQKGCDIAHSIVSAIKMVDKNRQAFIAGGANIYKQALESNLVDELIITEVHESFDADVFFPEIDNNTWVEQSRKKNYADDKNKYEYSFVNYLRKK